MKPQVDSVIANKNEEDHEQDWYLGLLQSRNSGVRFLTSVARDFNITVASLVMFVAVHTIEQHMKELTGLQASWHTTAKRLAGKLYSSKTQILVALHQAKAAGLLDYKQCRWHNLNGMRIWIQPDHAEQLYAEAHAPRDTYKWLRFRPLLAKVKGMGVDGSMLYLFIRHHQCSHRTAKSLATVFNHLSPKAIRSIRKRMVRARFLRREDAEKPETVKVVFDYYGDWDYERPTTSFADLFDKRKPEPVPTQYFCRLKLADRRGQIPEKQGGPNPVQYGPNPVQPWTKSGAVVDQNHHDMVTLSGKPYQEPEQGPNQVPSPSPTVAFGSTGDSASGHDVRNSYSQTEEELPPMKPRGRRINSAQQVGNSSQQVDEQAKHQQEHNKSSMTGRTAAKPESDKYATNVTGVKPKADVRSTDSDQGVAACPTPEDLQFMEDKQNEMGAVLKMVSDDRRQAKPGSEEYRTLNDTYERLAGEKKEFDRKLRKGRESMEASSKYRTTTNQRTKQSQ